MTIAGVSEPVSANLVVGVFLLVISLWEFVSKRANAQSKAKADWSMAAICLLAMALVQRPLVYISIVSLLSFAWPAGQSLLQNFDSQHTFAALVLFLLIEDFLHGFGHWVCHTRRFKNKLLAGVQSFYMQAHRPHHLLGTNAGEGKVTATQTFVEGWAYWFIMPNYWFHYAALYLGMYEAFVYALVIKGMWSVHNHVAWNYDLYFLNHPKALVRKAMRFLCHILIFPTQHQYHHARGKSSAKNLHNLFAFYDYFLWKTLIIGTEPPKQMGWRQHGKEQHSAWARFWGVQ